MKSQISQSGSGKISALAIIALVLALVQILLFAGAKLFQLPISITMLGALGIITVIISLIAFFRIKKSAGLLKGKSLAILSLILSIFPIIFLIAFLISISLMKR